MRNQAKIVRRYQAEVLRRILEKRGIQEKFPPRSFGRVPLNQDD